MRVCNLLCYNGGDGKDLLSFMTGRKSNLKGVERALCPFLLLTEKALIYHLSFTTAGYYINILIVWGVCRLIWLIRKRIDNGKTDDTRLS